MTHDDTLDEFHLITEGRLLGLSIDSQAGPAGRVISVTNAYDASTAAGQAALNMIQEANKRLPDTQWELEGSPPPVYVISVSVTMPDGTRHVAEQRLSPLTAERYRPGPSQVIGVVGGGLVNEVVRMVDLALAQKGEDTSSPPHPGR